MSFTPDTLSAIQQAGAAVYAADAALKTATQGYAAQVSAAMNANPFALGNDTLFNHWKLVARLTQMLSAMEQELQKVYHLGADLLAEARHDAALQPELPAPFEPLALAAPSVAPTDVRVKVTRRTTRAGARVASPRPANAERLLAHLSGQLNRRTFRPISQTECAHATGIALGSMTAALKTLVAQGQLVAGLKGQFKLGAPR